MPKALKYYLQDYLKMFDGINPPSAYEKFGERWEVGISPSDGSAQINGFNIGNEMNMVGFFY